MSLYASSQSFTPRFTKRRRGVVPPTIVAHPRYRSFHRGLLPKTLELSNRYQQNGFTPGEQHHFRLAREDKPSPTTCTLPGVTPFGPNGVNESTSRVGSGNTAIMPSAMRIYVNSSQVLDPERLYVRREDSGLRAGCRTWNASSPFHSPSYLPYCPGCWRRDYPRQPSLRYSRFRNWSPPMILPVGTSGS